MSQKSDKKSLDAFIKLLKKKNIKYKEAKSFFHNHALDLNECDKSGYNALHYAIKSENPEIVKLMLSLGSEEDDSLSSKADPNKETNDKNNNIFTSPLFLGLLYTNEESNSMQIIRHLCNAGANINYKDENGTTLFLHSCEKGRTDVINFLINKIIKDKEENKENEIKEVKNLINNCSKDGGGLHYAIIGQQDDIIELLLENNIDLNIINSYGDTALIYALKEKQMNLFKTIYDYLINNHEITDEEKKKILNHQNNEGNTILHELSYCKSSILTNMVLKLPKEISIDPEIINKEGLNYLEVSKNVAESESNIRKQEERIKEERRKLKEELRQKKYEEEKKIYEEKRRNEESLQRQAEFGQKLIENRGIIFTVILVIFLGMMFLVVKNAMKKKEIYI